MNLITQVDHEPMTFRVLSRSVWNNGRMDGKPKKGMPESYLVDLEFYRGHGKCGCKDFQFAHEKHVSVWVEPTPENPLECWHLTWAKRYFMRQFYKRIRMVMKDEPN